MSLSPRTVTALVCTLLAPLTVVLLPTSPAQAAVKHKVTVRPTTGSLTQWPSYAAGVERFAVVPSDAANRSVVLTARTSDRHGTVLVTGSR